MIADSAELHFKAVSFSEVCKSLGAVVVVHAATFQEKQKAD